MKHLKKYNESNLVSKLLFNYNRFISDLNNLSISDITHEWSKFKGDIFTFKIKSNIFSVESGINMDFKLFKNNYLILSGFKAEKVYNLLYKKKVVDNN